MKQFAEFKKTKGIKYVENRLSPITLMGVVIPWEKTLSEGTQSHYKLVCGSGAEYLILENSEIDDVLPLYCWKEVKIVGLLNRSNKTLIPQKVFPKGPDGESSNVIDLSKWRSLNLQRKVLNRINELVVVPAAVLAVLAS